MNNVEFKDVEQKIEELSARVTKIKSIDKVAQKQQELASLQQVSAAPEFWNDTQKAKEVSRQIDLLKTAIDTFFELQKRMEDAQIRPIQEEVY